MRLRYLSLLTSFGIVSHAAACQTAGHPSSVSDTSDIVTLREIDCTACRVDIAADTVRDSVHKYIPDVWTEFSVTQPPEHPWLTLARFADTSWTFVPGDYAIQFRGARDTVLRTIRRDVAWLPVNTDQSDRRARSRNFTMYPTTHGLVFVIVPVRPTASDTSQTSQFEIIDPRCGTVLVSRHLPARFVRLIGETRLVTYGATDGSSPAGRLWDLTTTLPPAGQCSAATQPPPNYKHGGLTDL